MLSHYLREEKHLNTAHFDLPDYQTDVGKLIDKYLNYVEMPPNPEVLHLLYAANRYEIRDVINFHLNDGPNSEEPGIGRRSITVRSVDEMISVIGATTYCTASIA